MAGNQSKLKAYCDVIIPILGRYSQVLQQFNVSIKNFIDVKNQNLLCRLITKEYVTFWKRIKFIKIHFCSLVWATIDVHKAFVRMFNLLVTLWYHPWLPKSCDWKSWEMQDAIVVDSQWKNYDRPETWTSFHTGGTSCAVSGFSVVGGGTANWSWAFM